MSLKFTKRAIASVLTGMSLLIANAVLSPSHAAQELFCTGRMNNGRNYNAQFLNGKFTQIRWEQAGQPPQVSPLTFSSTNSKGQPIYRGSFQGATAVTLVDLGKGNVQPGSEVSVGVEEWGWSRGRCGTSSASGETGAVIPIATVRQNLLGVEQAQARVWLRQNNFLFNTTVEHTNTRIIERWNQNATQGIDMTIVNSLISNVVEVR